MTSRAGSKTSVWIFTFLLLPFLFTPPLSAANGYETEYVSKPEGANPVAGKKSEKKKQPEKSLDGMIGAGLSLTSGNSDTLNWNVSFNLDKQTNRGHLLKASGLYLRGKENNKLSVDRLKLNLRDDYSINRDVVGFGDISYKRDPMKGIDHLVNPSAGLGWKILDEDKISVQANAGAGVVMEQNHGQDSDTSVSLNSSQSLSYKLSSTASFHQKMDVLWKADNIDDYLVNISLSLATKITNASELQAEFLDDFKSNPTDISYKKNDIALILKYVVRF